MIRAVHQPETKRFEQLSETFRLAGVCPMCRVGYAIMAVESEAKRPHAVEVHGCDDADTCRARARAAYRGS
jgi:hypothetical protein